jgi:hypothetical protein
MRSFKPFPDVNALAAKADPRFMRELGMVMMIVSLLGMVMTPTFVQFNQRVSAIPALSNVFTMANRTHALYNGTSSYLGLDNSVAVKTGIVPQTMVEDEERGVIAHPLGGAVSIQERSVDERAAAGFSISYQDIPATACAYMVSSPFPMSVVSVSVDEATFTNPLNSVEASAACDHRSQTVTWVFR